MPIYRDKLFCLSADCARVQTLRSISSRTRTCEFRTSCKGNRLNQAEESS